MKTKTQHTPGPWTLGDIKGGFIVGTVPVPEDRVRYAVDVPIAKVIVAEECGIDHATGVANARLIVASPDMLHALKVASRWIADQEHACGFPCDIIEAAIAKAEHK